MAIARSVVPAFLNERSDALHEFLSHPYDVGGVLSGDMDELLVVRFLPGVEDTVKRTGVFFSHLAGVDD